MHGEVGSASAAVLIPLACRRLARKTDDSPSPSPTPGRASEKPGAQPHSSLGGHLLSWNGPRFGAEARPEGLGNVGLSDSSLGKPMFSRLMESLTLQNLNSHYKYSPMLFSRLSV